MKKLVFKEERFLYTLFFFFLSLGAHAQVRWDVTGKYQFYGTSTLVECSDLSETVTLPETANFDIDGEIMTYTLTTIESAFNGCKNMKKLVIPKTVANVHLNSGYKCPLEEIDVVSENNNYLSKDGVLFTKDGNTLLRYPKYHAASTDYIVPSNVKTIDESAFYEAKKITKVTLPFGIETIKRLAFVSSTLNEINLPNTLTSIEERAFESTKLTSISIPASITSISVACFKDTKTLQNITIEEGLKEIKAGAFFGCTGLTNLNFLPASLTTLGNGVFSDCSNLEEAVIPNNVESMGDYLFYGATKLKKVVMPSKLKTLGIALFIECDQLQEIDFQENEYFTYTDEILFSHDMKTLYFFSPQKDISKDQYQYKIPNSVEVIHGGAFATKIPQLKTLVLPSNLKKIEELAFHRTSLTDLTIPASVETIATCAFSTPKGDLNLFLMGTPQFDLAVKLTAYLGNVQRSIVANYEKYVNLYVKKSNYDAGKYSSVKINQIGGVKSLSYDIPVKPAKELTSFCRDFDADFTTATNVVPYIATSISKEEGKGTSMLMTAQRYIPSRTGSNNDEYIGVILKTTEEGLSDGTTYRIGEDDYLSGSQTTLTKSNYLVGAPCYTIVQTTEESGAYRNYGLLNGVFKMYNNPGLINPYRAYLRLPVSIVNDGKPISFKFMDEDEPNNNTTTIKDVENKTDEKEMWHTLQGVKVNPQKSLPKGIYIRNGKKVLVK